MTRAAAMLSVLLAFAPRAEAQLLESWLQRALVPTRTTSSKKRSPAVFPPQSIKVRFSHELHTKDVACASCHDMVEASHRAADANIPAHEQCSTCHDVENQEAGKVEDDEKVFTCETCHTGAAQPAAVAPSTFPPNNLIFDHGTHVKRGAKCIECHGGVAETQLATRDDLPKMRTCLTCHDGRTAPDKCQTCHLAEPDGLLRTRFASGTLSPSGALRDDDHGRDFLKRHARLASSELDSCQSCHRTSECEACHTSSSKAFRIHPPDWTRSHAVVARGAEMECQSCHREQSFCTSCHQQAGAAFESPLRRAGEPLALKRFHPVGFAALVKSGPEHHAFAAQANIQACASCHEEQTCLQCHAEKNALNPIAGSRTTVNPHPPGFETSAAACRAIKASPVGCAKCHGGGAGLTGGSEFALQMSRCP